MDHIVDGIAGYTDLHYATIASAHKGSLLYVGIDSAIYSVSTFASSQFDGSKMQLIAGAAGQGSIRKDAELGIDSRFTLVTFMKTSLDDRTIYVLDKLETEPPRGWLRKIDVSTPNFAVTTLSSTAGSGGVCANDTFMSPRSMDIHKSTGNLLIVDSQCETIHTYIPSTDTFLLTAGIIIIIILFLFFCLYLFFSHMHCRRVLPDWRPGWALPDGCADGRCILCSVEYGRRHVCALPEQEPEKDTSTQPTRMHGSHCGGRCVARRIFSVWRDVPGERRHCADGCRSGAAETQCHCQHIHDAGGPVHGGS
jgi:hypothetical protein